MAVGFPTKANWAAGDILTAAQMDDLAGTVNTLANVPPRNAILNSNFSVWQRGTSFSLAASTAYTSGFTADRWQTATNANQACTISRQATGDTTNLPNIQYCLRYQRNSGQTGTSTLYILQNFETVNSVPFAGKAVTFSFYARAGANYSAASNALGFYVTSGTGTDQNYFSSYTGAAFNGGAATLTTTWARYSATFTLSSTMTEMCIVFAPTMSGTAGAADYYEVTGIQIDLGSTALPYRTYSATLAGELAACQRYYWRNTSGATFGSMALGFATSTTNTHFLVNCPVPMRITPTGLDASNLNVSDYVSLSNAVTAAAIVASESTNFCVRVDATTTGLTQYRPYGLRANNNTAAFIGLSAEL